uniref:Uncharacterized protein n=1 Tax=Rhizophora mucronata TaxID=61149 RepID=A0A2P2R0N6_RHIMU
MILLINAPLHLSKIFSNLVQIVFDMEIYSYDIDF